LGDEVFIGSVTALQICMPAVRDQKPDIILLITHQGLRPADDHANEIHAIASAFPEIQFIIGGHSHRVVEHEYLGKTLYTQAGYYGIWVGQLDIAYDTVAKQVISADAKIHPVDSKVPFEPELEKLCRPEIARAKSYVAEKIGTGSDALDTKPDARGNSPVQMLLCRAIADVAKADIVLHGSLSDDPLPAGDITMGDVWRIVPYENTIGVIHITTEQIAKILEENGARIGTIHHMGTYGLHFDWEKGADGKMRAVKLRDANDKPLHGRKRYAVAMNSYDLASGGHRFQAVRDLADEPESRLDMTGVDTRTALIDYIKKNSPLKRDVIIEGAQ
jgi:2',3'-cyclic-nucleotide 2'-phosphodiesterase (5'-nucleotidase family)